MYNFNDKQRRQLLEDALVADLLDPRSSAQPTSTLPRNGTRTVAKVSGLAGKTASA